MTDKTIELTGRIFLIFDIETKSGLHIGGSGEGISIGGVDKTVVRDPMTNRPYIPGSSLRGKIRSLLEKYSGAPQNKSIGRDVKIHVAEDWGQYNEYLVCQVFGVPGESKISAPTRLIVRDVHMNEKSADELNKLRTDLPFTEVKTEVAIDRVTSAASPRQMERVPANVIFSNAEMVYSLYNITGADATSNGINKDLERLRFLITGLELLEDDYLGGLGSRGSGKVALKNIKVILKTKNNYTAQKVGEECGSLSELVNKFDELKKIISEKIS
jgi:CRISPR-associated protein Csm3